MIVIVVCFVRPLRSRKEEVDAGVIIENAISSRRSDGDDMRPAGGVGGSEAGEGL